MTLIEYDIDKQLVFVLVLCRGTELLKKKNLVLKMDKEGYKKLFMTM